MIALQTPPSSQPPQPKPPSGLETPATRVSPTPGTNGNGTNGNGTHRALNLASFPPDPAAISLLPRSIAERLKIVPLQRRSDMLVVAMTDTTNVHTIDEVQRVSGCRIGAVAASAAEIEMAIARLYTAPSDTARAERAGPAAETRRVPESMLLLGGENATAEEAPIIRLLNQILVEAIDQRASDVHIEPHEHALVIRYRIDGVLNDWFTFPTGNHAPLVARVKVLANMDIAKHMIPLDGRFTTQIGGQRWDVRVSTVPGVFGESAVLRLLPKDGKGIALEQLGMQEGERRLFQSLIAKPYGMILVTGPTGAGKTTTLYTALQQLDCVSAKVITIEDPVEYELPRVTQIQVHPKIGLTFAAGLRHVLRQDPDILMVGEIRDSETLEMAVQAALTGHLVLSTLHCNDAASAAVRALDMELEPFLFTSSVIGVLAQRLVRRVCQECKKAELLPEAVREKFGVTNPRAACYRGQGCPACRQTGYRGRLAVFEMLVLDDPIKEAIQHRAPAADLRKIAAARGMVSLREDAIRKVQMGLTTPEEVMRAVYLEGE